jgi:hypothetical protein
MSSIRIAERLETYAGFVGQSAYEFDPDSARSAWAVTTMNPGSAGGEPGMHLRFTLRSACGAVRPTAPAAVGGGP